MREATRLTRCGHLNEATQAIQRALNGATVPAVAPDHAPASTDAMVLDGCVSEVGTTAPAMPEVAAAPARTVAHDSRDWTHASTDEFQPKVPTGQGVFISGSHTQSSMTRRYKLYMPPGHAGKALPLVVMLHGCTQDPDDFAVGTGMNERAREQGFLVLYPAQAQDANPQRCWNWFKHNHQQRGSGEPALIASLTQAVMKEHGIDPRRVYVAGLSAGGAMAAIVAEAYPDIFAAVGVHSGLPGGSARSVPEALAVMNSGTASPIRNARAGHGGTAPAPPLPPHRPVPTIVFHGDQDRTVHPRNGEQVIAAALGRAHAAQQAVAGPSPAHTAGQSRVEQGVSAHGRRYTRCVHTGHHGEALAEHWQVHGAGHAWSGGHAQGSYTDGQGPDATREMLRFFFEHPHV